MTGNVADQPLTKQASHLTRRNFLLSSTAAAAGMALYSAEWARHELSIVPRTLAIDNLPAAFHGFRIAQISDIHFDDYSEPFFVRRVVDRLNALAPDLVLLTGDFISFTSVARASVVEDMRSCAEVLRNIACPQRFAVMGNHDTLLGLATVQPALAAAGIPLLVNEFATVERAGQRLCICGVRDPVTDVPDLDRAIPAAPDGPVLLLSHGPDYADVVAAHPRGQLVDLMLAGHSHGGQVRLPIVGALHTPEGGSKYVEGFFRLGRMQLYVNRGIGTVNLPLRLNCPPEITLFTLQKG